jgi:hypothetical protein
MSAEFGFNAGNAVSSNAYARGWKTESCGSRLERDRKRLSPSGLCARRQLRQTASQAGKQLRLLTQLGRCDLDMSALECE